MSIHHEQHSEFLKLAQYVFAIPAHGGNVEHVFSLMEVQWTDERNRLQLDTVESILMCKYNFKNTFPNFTSMLKLSQTYFHRLHRLLNMNGIIKKKRLNSPDQVQANKY